MKPNPNHPAEQAMELSITAEYTLSFAEDRGLRNRAVRQRYAEKELCRITIEKLKEQLKSLFGNNGLNLNWTFKRFECHQDLLPANKYHSEAIVIIEPIHPAEQATHLHDCGGKSFVKLP